jgi:hypothetical protein
MVIRRLARKPVELWNRYERHLSAGSMVVGFIFDLFLAKRPDSELDNLLLLCYLGLAAFLIIALNLRTARKRRNQPSYQPLFLLLVLQFCFGGLSSNLLVLYGRSGTFAGSALFIIILFGMLIGNEFLKTRYSQLRFNIVVFYWLLLTYCVISVPTFVLHAVGTWVFLTSGAISLAVVAAFLALVYVVVLRGEERIQQIYEVSVLVLLVFGAFSGLYFLNIIPPVPLSLKDIGVYHTIDRLNTPAGGSHIYGATYEPAPWYKFWRDTSSTYTVVSAEQAICYSSVFAPTDLSTPVYNRWEKYNDATKSWQTVARTSFPINGGRGEGYRGYTFSTVSPGRWRCDVENQNGALIGRVGFTVVLSATKPKTATREL